LSNKNFKLLSEWKMFSGINSHSQKGEIFCLLLEDSTLLKFQRIFFNLKSFQSEILTHFTWNPPLPATLMSSASFGWLKQTLQLRLLVLTVLCCGFAGFTLHLGGLSYSKV